MQSTKELMAFNWDDQAMQTQLKNQIKVTFGSELTPMEWNLYMAIGKMTGLNPMLKEIWAVKYGKKAAQIFIGRDGYRKSAQAHTEYDYHIKGSVYSSDIFRYENGEVYHQPNLKDPGDLMFAYCLTKRKSSSRANYTRVLFNEYYAGNKDSEGRVKVKKFKNEYNQQWEEKPMGETLWDTKPATMIEKVAEAQGLRMTFQELFAGTLDESEAYDDENNGSVIPMDDEATIKEFENKIASVKDEDGMSLILSKLKKAYEAKEISQPTGARLKALCAEKKGSLKKEDKKPEATVEDAEKIFGTTAEDVTDGEVVNKPKRATHTGPQEEKGEGYKPYGLGKSEGVKKSHGEEDPCEEKGCPIHNPLE